MMTPTQQDAFNHAMSETYKYISEQVEDMQTCQLADDHLGLARALLLLSAGLMTAGEAVVVGGVCNGLISKEALEQDTKKMDEEYAKS